MEIASVIILDCFSVWTVVALIVAAAKPGGYKLQTKNFTVFYIS